MPSAVDGASNSLPSSTSGDSRAARSCTRSELTPSIFSPGSLPTSSAPTVEPTAACMLPSAFAASLDSATDIALLLPSIDEMLLTIASSVPGSIGSSGVKAAAAAETDATIVAPVLTAASLSWSGNEAVDESAPQLCFRPRGLGADALAAASRVRTTCSRTPVTAETPRLSRLPPPPPCCCCCCLAFSDVMSAALACVAFLASPF